MEYKEDIRIQKTKRDLRNAISILIQEKSIEKISVTEICTKAMVNRITFYKYYEDKYHLLDDTFYEISQEISDSISIKCLSSLEDAKEYCAELLSAVVKLVEEQMNFIAALLKNGNHQMINIILNIIETRITELLSEIDKIRPIRYSIPCMASFISGGFIQSISYWINHPFTHSESIIYQMIDDLRNDVFSLDFLYKS